MFAAKTLSKMVLSGLTFGEHCVKLLFPTNLLKVV